jgi:hypothetical protein
LYDKQFLNRRYCLTTNGQAEKTISNRRYSLYQLQILKTRLHAKPFLNRRYCLTTKAQAEKTISNRGYSLYQPQIPKTRLYDKPFFNRRYCLTTNGQAEKTISNRGYSLYQPQILKTRLYGKPFLNRRKKHFKSKIFIIPTPSSQSKIVRQPFLNRKYCLTTNGQAEKTISNRRYSLYQPKFSKQDCTTNNLLIEDIVRQSNENWKNDQPQIPKTRL